MLTSIDTITEAINGLALDIKATLQRSNLSGEFSERKFKDYCSEVIDKVCQEMNKDLAVKTLSNQISKMQEISTHSQLIDFFSNRY